MTSSGKSLGFSVFIEIKFDRNVYYTASSNAFVIYARTWGLTPYTASLPKGRNSAKEFINEKIIDFVDVFSINLLEQNKN
jgi:hypothetical protein